MINGFHFACCTVEGDLSRAKVRARLQETEPVLAEAIDAATEGLSRGGGLQEKSTFKSLFKRKTAVHIRRSNAA